MNITLKNTDVLAQHLSFLPVAICVVPVIVTLSSVVDVETGGNWYVLQWFSVWLC